MATFHRTQSKSLAQQKVKLQQTYPDLIDYIGISHGELVCVMRLQPTPESIEYRVRIGFKLEYWPTAKMLEPKEIAKVDGQKPHHLYNRSVDGQERLCVFYPRGHEWNDNMFLADAFIPWVITWLSAYEIWQITGLWVYPEQHDRKPKQEKTKE